MNQEWEEVKMSMIRKRSPDHNQKKMYQCKDSVPVFDLVCEKMTDRVEVVRQEVEYRRIRQDRRTMKMMRVLQTRERSDRSQT